MPKIIRNNILLLAGQKSQTERRRITLRTIASETVINSRAIYGIANDTLQHYPKDVVLALCTYFGCELTDLLYTTDEELAPDPPAGARHLAVE